MYEKMKDIALTGFFMCGGVLLLAITYGLLVIAGEYQ